MKFIADTTGQLNSQATRYIGYAIALLLLSVIHLVLLDFISVAGITPNLILILVVWITLKEGPFISLFAGFGCGLFFDIISNDLIGMNALTLTVVAFTASWFWKEDQSDKIIGSYKFLLIVLICSVIHNLIYFFFFIKPSEISFFSFFLKYGIAVSLYTTIFAIFPMFVKFPKRGY